VINSQGKISARSGAERQRMLLEEEGVVFVKDKVDFKKYGWRGPGEEDEPRQESLF
jgi:alkylated DNA nucleotide flippase Atl1